MGMRIRGKIHMIELDNKIIGIVVNRRIEFFYFQNSQMNVFKRYLYVDNWIDLDYSENRVKKGSFLAHPVKFVYRIEAIGKFDHIIYYDKVNLNGSLKEFLNSFDNTMFLDLEMTMPSYNYKGKAFRAEVIQAGLVIFDKDGKEILRYSNYIKPKLLPKLSKRALDFLSIEEEDFEKNSIRYEQFYDDFHKMITKYNPAIIVYGKNDSIVLNDSYEINYMPSLKNKTRFVNILQLIKNFYELRNDPGLFKLYNVYFDVENNPQLHDAFDDCYKTYKVFEAFKKDLETKESMKKIRENFD